MSVLPARLAAPARREPPSPVPGERPGRQVVAALILGAGLGALTPFAPVVAVAVVAAVIVLVWLLWLGPRSRLAFLATLGVLIAAYAMFNRGIAYVGAGGVYIGELTLVLGLLPLIRAVPRLRFGTFELVIVAFIAWGAARTIPYLGLYGVSAIRDGAMWGYALFALLVSALLTPGAVTRAVSFARRFIPFFLSWIPVATVVTAFASAALPSWPGAPVPLLVVKHGDFGVYLAIIAAFMLVGLYERRPSSVPAWAIWCLWLADVALIGAMSRGGLVSVAIGAASALLFVRSSRRLGQVIGIGLGFFVALYLVNPSISLSYVGREVSFSQLVDNVISVASDQANDAGSLAGTKAWRLAWWNEIIGYTVDGPYRWSGKGFGINLADDDGFQVKADRSLRSPHSAHFSLLARGGIPMLALWLLINGIFAVRVLRAGLVARRTGQRLMVQVMACVFALWVAAFVNMSFDVYLEGPQGGILFWTTIGVGIWLARAVKLGISLEHPAGVPVPAMPPALRRIDVPRGSQA